MVEIIKPGQLPEEQVYHATCNNCHTYFRFKRKEAKYISSSMGAYSSLEITCPFSGCNKLVYVSLDNRIKWPTHRITTPVVDKDILFD